VRVREYPDGILAVFHGPRRIAAYTALGAQIAAVPTMRINRRPTDLEAGDIKPIMTATR
jgi:hypothetical protein